MKRKIFILSFLAILSFASSAAAFTGGIIDETKDEIEIPEELVAYVVESLKSETFNFGDTKFNEWADSKEYKLAIAEFDAISTDMDEDKHIENAIKHLEKELKQHPQNAYAEYSLSKCKQWIDKENEAEVKVLIDERLEHLSKCIDKLPSADVDSKIVALLERSSIYKLLLDNEEQANKDILQAFKLKPTYENFELISEKAHRIPNDLKREMALIAVKNDPENVDLNLILGDCYGYDDPEKALDFYNAACASHNSARALVSRAQFFVSNDDYSNALNDLTEADKRFDLAKEECDGMILNKTLENKTLEEESVILLSVIASVNDIWFNRVAKTCDNGTLSKYKNYILGKALLNKEYDNEVDVYNSCYKAITYFSRSIEEDNVYDGVTDLADCYEATGDVEKAVDVLFNNFNNLPNYEKDKLFNLEIKHKLYDRCISEAKTFNFVGQIEDKDMLDYVGHAQFLKHDYNAVVDTYNNYITSIRDYINEDIPLSAFIEDGNIDFFYYACSLIITGKEKDGRELMSLMSDVEHLFIAEKSKKILALHFAGREAEAIASLDQEIEDSTIDGEEYEQTVNLNDICLYTILGQSKKAKLLISSDKFLLVDDTCVIVSIYEDEAIDQKLNDIILELSDTPLIDLTEFKQLVQSK